MTKQRANFGSNEVCSFDVVCCSSTLQTVAVSDLISNGVLAMD